MNEKEMVSANPVEAVATPTALDPLSNEWMRFIEVFPEIEEPIRLFDEKALLRIEAGATPMEAFLLRLYTQLHEGYRKQEEKLQQLSKEEKRRSRYPGSLQNQHPAPESDPFLEGIKGI